jgi:serine/threonine-protein kinase
VKVATGTVIDGRYRVLERVGSGGMADVYCAEDSRLGRTIAIKVLHERFSQDREFVERFRREASAAAGLQHPNIVGVYDRGDSDGAYYIAMEFVEGETLKDVIRREAPMDPGRTISIVKEILAATRFAHKRGVIHRDLKPQNVIVEPDDHIKVADFGIARASGSDITEVGAIMGTAQYLSPEQAHGQPVTAASDIYSIGVVMFEMLTGRAPFEADSPVAVALKHVNQPAPSPREFVPSVPPELEAIVLKALAKDPERRYPDAESMMRDLEVAQSRLGANLVDTESTVVFAPVPVPIPPPEPVPDVPPPAMTTPPPAELPPPSPPGDRNDRRRMLLLLGLVAAVLLALLAFTLLRNQPTEIVPQVIGQTLDSARVEIGAKNLGVDVKRRADPAPADTVIDQVPGAGTKVDRDSTVTLIVSNGPTTVKMPDVVGLPLHDARARLKRAGLRVDVTREPSGSVNKGIVIRSDPGPDRLTERGSSVTVFVSTGPQQVTVPDLLGRDEQDAVAQLRDLHLSPEIREKSSDKPQGTVVDQTPTAGIAVAEGTTVTIFVSNANVAEVPDVTGLRQSTAEGRLGREGFDVSVRMTPTTDPAQDGLVISQSPAGGAKRSKGAVITITVGQPSSSTPGGTP